MGDNFGGAISNCYATGNVSGCWGGGVAGGNSSGTISNCYATASVSGTMSGDLVGWNFRSVSNCVALNPSVTSTWIENLGVGRVVGRIDNDDANVLLTNNYALSSMTVTFLNGSYSYTPGDTINADNNKDGANVSVGTGAGQYNNQSFWTGTMGWNFTTIWEWDTARQLPKLRGVGP